MRVAEVLHNLRCSKWQACLATGGQNFWEMHRAQNALPRSGRRKFEAVDMTSFRKEEQYADIWDEGELQDVDSFLTGQGVDIEEFASMDQKLRFIQEECHTWFSFLNVWYGRANVDGAFGIHMALLITKGLGFGG